MSLLTGPQRRDVVRVAGQRASVVTGSRRSMRAVAAANRPESTIMIRQRRIDVRRDK